MVCETFSNIDSAVHRFDPRVRVVIAFALAIAISASTRLPVPVLGFALGIIAVLVARLPVWSLVRRMAAVNIFMLVLAVVLPLTTPGDPLLQLGTLAWSRAGAQQVLEIVLKANAVVLIYSALVSTIELATLGHAFSHLYIPAKLTHLFLFTVRYVDVLHHEYQRLRTAMRVRCFRPRVSWHTYRTYGYLVGMLLVNSIDRSERIMQAMQCRGFNGRFHLLTHFAAGKRDLAFGLASTMILALMGWLQWR